MRKVFLTTFILSILLSFTGCGSDDPERTQKYFNGTCKLTIPLEAPEGSTITTPAESSSLEEMLKDYPNAGFPISSGEIYPTEGTSIKITGLPAGVILKNFTLNINGIEKSFGNIVSGDNDNTNLFSKSNLEFFSNAFNAIIIDKDKKIKAKVTYSPSARISQNDNVKVEIVYYAKFYYWVTL